MLKTILLSCCAISVLGILGEKFYRSIQQNGFKSLKLVLMIPVYFIYGGIMILFNLIPFFSMIYMLPVMMLLGGFIATLLELIFGLFYNKLLKLNIWDYKEKYIKILFIKIPTFNQINLKHSLLYMLLSPIAFYVDDIVKFLAK